MNILSIFLIIFVLVQHVGFFILETFLWTHDIGMKVFRQSPEAAQLSAPLAANQGLYNLFLAAGLLWSLWQPEPVFAWQIKIFFLGCVLVAALFGAYTVSYRILLVQGIPAALALVTVFIR